MTVDNSASSATSKGEPGERLHSGELGHGNSPAAWTCVGVMLIGAIISCIAFVLGSSATVLFIVGLVVIAIGLVLGGVLKSMGYGVGGSKLKNSGH